MGLKPHSYTDDFSLSGIFSVRRKEADGITKDNKIATDKKTRNE